MQALAKYLHLLATPFGQGLAVGNKSYSTSQVIYFHMKGIKSSTYIVYDHVYFTKVFFSFFHLNFFDIVRLDDEKELSKRYGMVNMYSSFDLFSIHKCFR